MIAQQKSLKILVAEDDDLISELLSELLVSMGHVVCTITSTEAETVRATLEFEPELLIVDYKLSPGSGIAALEQILRKRHFPHIVVSSNIAGVLALRPDAIMLEKPFTQASLADAILRASAIA